MERKFLVLNVAPMGIDHALRPANQRESAPPEIEVNSGLRICVAANLTSASMLDLLQVLTLPGRALSAAVGEFEGKARKGGLSRFPRFQKMAI